VVGVIRLTTVCAARYPAGPRQKGNQQLEPRQEGKQGRPCRRAESREPRGPFGWCEPGLFRGSKDDSSDSHLCPTGDPPEPRVAAHELVSSSTSGLFIGPPRSGLHLGIMGPLTRERGLSVAKEREYEVVLVPQREGGFTLSVPELPDVVTEGESREEALAMAKEAIEAYLETMRDHGWISPRASGTTS